MYENKTKEKRNIESFEHLFLSFLDIFFSAWQNTFGATLCRPVQQAILFGSCHLHELWTHLCNGNVSAVFGFVYSPYVHKKLCCFDPLPPPFPNPTKKYVYPCRFRIVIYLLLVLPLCWQILIQACLSYYSTICGD